MALITKQVQADGSARLFADGVPIARIWLQAHADRIIRDADFAEAIAAINTGGAAARRAAARVAFDTWSTAGGHSVNFNTLTLSQNNDAGVPDSDVDPNRHIYIAGNDLGYLHGGSGVLAVARRLARFIRLAEELFAGEQLSQAADRNAALEAAVTRFRDDGALD